MRRATRRHVNLYGAGWIGIEPAISALTAKQIGGVTGGPSCRYQRAQHFLTPRFGRMQRVRNSSWRGAVQRSWVLPVCDGEASTTRARCVALGSARYSPTRGAVGTGRVMMPRSISGDSPESRRGGTNRESPPRRGWLAGAEVPSWVVTCYPPRVVLLPAARNAMPEFRCYCWGNVVPRRRIELRTLRFSVPCSVRRTLPRPSTFPGISREIALAMAAWMAVEAGGRRVLLPFCYQAVVCASRLQSGCGPTYRHPTQTHSRGS